jgi:hypothetical protein
MTIQAMQPATRFISFGFDKGYRYEQKVSVASPRETPSLTVSTTQPIVAR